MNWTWKLLAPALLLSAGNSGGAGLWLRGSQAGPKPPVAAAGTQDSSAPAAGAGTPQQKSTEPAKNAAPKKAPAKQPPAAPGPPTPEEELQETISSAGNDRASLVRNLEEYLKKYPGSPQRPRIYRALVEASLQIRDTTRAADYAERIVALTPEDMSMTLVAIQLLERGGDEAALKRAVEYATRVLQFVEKTKMDEKSPQLSPEEWQASKTRDRTSMMLLRGRLYLKLRNNAAAQQDFESSYALLPSAAAAEKLGELAELKKDQAQAVKQYARAFALADGTNGSTTRREIRQKLGNVWRQSNGSPEGLGELLLRSFDEVTESTAAPKSKKNAEAREISAFTLRKAPDGAPFPLAGSKGKVTVVDFWATWCGPCRALKPQFERVAAQFSGNPEISFLEANCDEDESLVGPYLEEEKPRATAVFADGLDRLLSVESFPTVVVVDGAGKIVYRAEGFGDDGFERELARAAQRALESGHQAATKSSATP